MFQSLQLEYIQTLKCVQTTTICILTRDLNVTLCLAATKPVRADKVDVQFFTILKCKAETSLQGYGSEEKWEL